MELVPGIHLPVADSDIFVAAVNLALTILFDFALHCLARIKLSPLHLSLQAISLTFNAL